MMTAQELMDGAAKWANNLNKAPNMFDTESPEVAVGLALSKGVDKVEILAADAIEFSEGSPHGWWADVLTIIEHVDEAEGLGVFE